MKKEKEKYYGAVCWICEKPIEGGVFSPIVKTKTGDASACDKHATHKWESIGNGQIRQVEICKN